MLAIGMDVHSSKTTAYAVPLEESDLNMCAIAEDFNKSFRNFNSDRPGYAKVASFLEGIEHCILIENSTKSHEVFWIMSDLDLTVVVAHATDLFRITKSVKKTDQHDCYELAHYMRRRMLGEFEFAECLMVDRRWMDRRQLCRAYAWESEMLSDTRRQIKSYMLLRGIRIENMTRDITSVSNLKALDLIADDTLSLLLTRARDFKNRILACEKAIRKEFSDDEMFALLFTVPGFGLITTAYIVSMVVDINRFRNDKAFAAYFGIVPAQRESANSAPRCPITRRGDETARKMILQSTFVHIKTDRDKLSPITQMYDRLIKRGIPHKKALTAAGNKMARMVFTILKNKEPYKF
ncbi:IS110 family RNA-guided transposase [Methanomethylophilus alvi]|uniref:IS110 family transposase n=1 Tax=Methanomethylophilus alvi TaxID=1291540 RepID=UPI0037DD536D